MLLAVPLNSLPGNAVADLFCCAMAAPEVVQSSAVQLDSVWGTRAVASGSVSDGGGSWCVMLVLPASTCCTRQYKELDCALLHGLLQSCLRRFDCKTLKAVLWGHNQQCC
jgi:hypothetical protein